VQNTGPLCKEELLLDKLLLLKIPKGEEEEETPANEEELTLIGQDATIVPPKEIHASARISAQPVAYLQGAKPLCKKEEELSVFPKISSADSMSDVQENSKPVAITSGRPAANRKLCVFIIRMLLLPASTHPRQTFGEKSGLGRFAPPLV
jgi:hypothetical protein